VEGRVIPVTGRDDRGETPLTSRGLVVLALALSALVASALVVNGVETLADRATAAARAAAAERARDLRDRVASAAASSPGATLAERAARALRDPALEKELARSGAHHAAVVKPAVSPGGRRRDAPDPDELALPLDEHDPAAGTLRLELRSFAPEIEAARRAALGWCSGALAAALLLEGLGIALAGRVGQERRARRGAARARARLARLGWLASGLAQEIRSPLGAIREHVAQLHERVEDDPPPLDPCCLTSTEICERALGEAARLDGLVRDFVAWARPELTPPRLADVAPLVAEWVKVLEPELAARELSIALEGAGPPATAVVDPGGLKQIFWSLVRNARDAAPRGTIVRVAIVRDPERVRISVSDRGPGIAPERRSEVFEPFVSTKPEGAGLGLAISMRLAEAMGATLSIAGGPPGAVLELGLRRAPSSIRFLAEPRVGSA
jgi:signal transduction histidine kinase